MARICTVEGNSFSGKTTLTAELSKELGYKVVGEPSEYTDVFPAFPPTTYGEAKSAINTFMGIEKQRSDDARELAEHSDVIMERSLWTYAVFQFVVMKRMPEIPNSYMYCLDVIEKLVNSKEILLPPAIILLSPGSQAVFEQRLNQRGAVDIAFLNDWETTTHINEWLGNVIKTIYRAERGQSFNTDIDIGKLARSVNNFILGQGNFQEILFSFDGLRDLNQETVR